MSQSNPPPPEIEWGGHVLVVEMHAGTQPPLWVTIEESQPRLLRLLDERSAVARDELEAAIADAKRLEHASLHRATKLIEASGALGIDSPYVEGMLLTAVIQRATVRRRPLPQVAALGIALDVLEALAAAEREGMSIAGGVRPDFVLVGVDGRARVLEPSAARILLGLEPWREDAKCASYASPEQLEHGQPSERSDVFTVGVLLWEMLTNRRLFMGSSYPIVAKTVMQGDVRPVEDVSDAPVRDDLAELVADALAIDPDARVASVAAFAEALRGIVEDARYHEEVAAYLAETQTPLLDQRRSRIAEALHLPPEEVAPAVEEKPDPSPPPPPKRQEPKVIVAAPPLAPRKRKSDRPPRSKRNSERPARRSDRPKRSNRPRPPPPGETPFPVVRRADDPVIRARDIRDAELTRRRWPMAMIGIGALAAAVGSGIAFLRHGAADREQEQPASESPPAPPQPAAPKLPEPRETEPAEPDSKPVPAAIAEPAAPEPAPKPPEPVAAPPKPKARNPAETTPPPAVPKPKAPPKETPPAGDFDPGGI